MVNKKVLICTHVDLDGSTSEVIMRKVYPDATVIRINYGFEEEERYINLIDEHDVIIIVDMSVSKEYAEVLNNYVVTGQKIVRLLDHHASAIEKYEGKIYDWMILDTERCGALIAYDYFQMFLRNGGAYRVIAEVTDDYDRWLHNDPNSIRLQFLWSALGQDAFAERFLANPHLEFRSEEEELIKDSMEKFETAIQSAEDSLETYRYDENTTFAVCEVGQFASLVCDRVLKNHKDIDFLVGHNTLYDTLSFRSLHYEVNKIAESLEGGGHPLAAGAKYHQLMDIPQSVINGEITKYDLMSKLNLA